MSVQLPTEFVQKMQQLLKDEAEAFFQSFKEKRTAGLRINPLKIQKETWEKISPFSLEPVGYEPYGYTYDYDRDEPGKHPYHHAGLYYIQEPSAMFVAPLLDARPGEKILDLCAAPGGKATQIGAAMNNEGILVANEIHPKRARALSENIERFGITNAIVTNESPERLAEHFPYYFDKILLDAPCSGEGMFRKDEDAVRQWSCELTGQCQKRQLNILDSAWKMLKEGGILVYSTCTFSPEENEQVIEQFVKTYPNLEIVEIQKRDGISPGRPEWTVSDFTGVEKCARLWPHKLKGEGHFTAKLRKRENTPKPATKRFRMKKKQPLNEFFQFQKEYMPDVHFPDLQLFGAVLHSLPAGCPDLSGLKVLRAGLHLGEMKKNRFKPGHALALALKKDEFSQTVSLSPEGEEWKKYLRGETLNGTGKYKGWVLVLIGDYPIGFGKEAGEMIKNFYPKGLRIF